MLKTVAITLVILLFGLLAWVAFQSSDISIIVNGQKLAGPEKLVAGGWGLLVAMIVLFSAATLLVFVVAGTGLIVLSGLVIAGFLVLWLAFPFVLPLLVPLLIVWVFVAAVRGNRKPGA